MEEIKEMTAFETCDYLDAWSDMTEPKKPKKYLVLKKPKEGSGEQKAVATEGTFAAAKALGPEGDK